LALQEEMEEQGVWLFRYRGILPVIILAIGAFIYLWGHIHPETSFFNGTRYEEYFQYFCLALSLFGLAIRVYTVGRVPKNTSGRNKKNQMADVLNTTGIYSMVRHPLYVGNFFMWLGPAALTGNPWFIATFCLFYWVYYERIMFAEEQYLRRKFGDEYTKWAEKVPAFVPCLANFKACNACYSWKKTIRREKNGVLAIFLIFMAFDIAAHYINGQDHYNTFFIAMTGLSILYYTIVKVLQKTTSFFKESYSA